MTRMELSCWLWVPRGVLMLAWLPTGEGSTYGTFEAHVNWRALGFGVFGRDYRGWWIAIGRVAVGVGKRSDRSRRRRRWRVPKPRVRMRVALGAAGA